MKRCIVLIVVAVLVVSRASWAETPTPSDANPNTSQPQQVKVYHDGSVRDLDAIGNRNVGCSRGMFNWYSLESQVNLGREFAQQVEQQSRLIKDPVVEEYINRLGQNLVRNSDAKVPFTIRVIDSDDVNAFALPGGFFFVNSGLILNADNEAELAGVMAHEIAHVAACHAARGQTRGQLANLASIPLIFVGGGWAVYAATQVAGIAVPATFMKFSRNFETEADLLGLQYLYKSGYDPQAFTAFFEKIAALQKKKPGIISQAFSSHPPTPDRIEKSQEEISTLLPPRDQYVVNTSEFDDVKARLARLVNRHRLNEQKEKEPTLRRASRPPADTSGSTGNEDDGRPTLKRTDPGSDTSTGGTTPTNDNQPILERSGG